MLHDPGSYSPPQRFTEITLAPAERDVMKRLAGEIASIAALPVHREKADLWRSLNDLESERPMVWINEIPWHEMNVNDELTLRTAHPWAREVETRLRRTLYQWRHMRGDMIVSDFLECPLAIHSTDFGIHEDVEIARTDAASDIVSRHFHVQIRDPEDIEKIRMPRVTHDEETTAVTFAVMEDLFKDIMPVRKVGQTHIWYTPWDYLIRWWGLQEAMIDLIERPEMVNAAVERMVDAWMIELDQFVEQNLLSLDCDNTRIGSGGYGYTRKLPGAACEPSRVRPGNMWGCSNAQIFSNVSPQMHWEFALRHDMRWLERWGLTYYGCCEPLDNKIHLLRRIRNLRKISMSPWNDFGKVIDQVKGDYVLSFKPSPAVFVEEEWDPRKARACMKSVLDQARGVSHVEIIMKDISTVRYRPERLWDWTRVAMELAEAYA
ncbi:MAG TPA: hypothetical protein VMU36_04960 [Spirochaetia bacterium]|nr:hypothetical protein [Spirochaetia bacterium]